LMFIFDVIIAVNDIFSLKKAKKEIMYYIN